MPKELVHWWIAAEAARRLPSESACFRLISEHMPYYLTGAVLPDTLLHLISGKSSYTALDLADAFHNTKLHSYGPLVDFLENTATAAEAPGLTACLLGVATHMEADIVFHPFVYSLAGEDIGKHYRVETDLDLWLLKQGKTPPNFSLKQLATKETKAAAAKLIRKLFDPEQRLSSSDIDSAVKKHAVFQAMYGNPFWQGLAILLGMIPKTRFSSWQQLFYPFFWRRGKAVSWPSDWTHPSTGTTVPLDLDQLLENAVSRTLQLLQNVDRFGIVQALKKQPGENLLTGLPPKKPHDYIY